MLNYPGAETLKIFEEILLIFLLLIDDVSAATAHPTSLFFVQNRAMSAATLSSGSLVFRPLSENPPTVSAYVFRRFVLR